MSSLIGQSLGRYHILEQLGEGGMATVYKAYDTRLECDMAVKVIRIERLAPEILGETLKRFKREAKALAKLTHQNIVKVLDYGEYEGKPYLVMPYLPGGTLKQRLGKPIPWDEAVRMLLPISRALGYAHKQGIIHRDVKPSNVLLTESGDPMLSDFGIAKMFGDEETIDLTATGMTIGTPEYMAPEQTISKTVDQRADIYALGVVLYEMVTGRKPYQADTPLGVLFKHANEPLPRPRSIVPEIPEAAEAVIFKALAKKPEDRFQSMEEFAEALTSLPTKRLGRAFLPPKSKAAPSKFKNPPLGFIVLVVVVLCLAGLGGGFYVLRNSPLRLLATATKVLPTQIPLPPSATIMLTATATATSTLTPTQPPTFTPTMSPTPTTVNLPTLGGADMIAFLNGNNIWIMNVDGNNLKKLTSDSAEKTELQWLPDGENILYVTGKCIQIVNINTQLVTDVTCFNSADYLEGFEISPTHSQVAISLNRELFVVPFDIETLKNARSRSSLLNGCLTYTSIFTKGVRWSNTDGEIAVVFLGVDGARHVDTIRVLDIHRCGAGEPLRLDEFPGARFTMSGYNDNPVIPSFDWDGESIFLLNSSVRNDGFGYLYAYNMGKYKAEMLDPLGTSCCYRDARWSPDRNHIIFAYQNIMRSSETQLYYIPFGSLGTGATYQPIPLPTSFFTNPREKPQPALRPAK